MLVRDKEFLIVREVCARDDGTQFIFKDPSSDNFYKVLVQKKDSISGDLIKFLSKQIKNKPFTDFIDYMNDFENLYVFMKYDENICLKEKITEEICTLSERLTIAKKIIEKIIILDIPPYFSSSSMSVENILVSKSGDIFFDYDLQEINSAFRIKEAQSIQKMAEIFIFLFEKELKEEVMPEMQTLIYNMQYGEITKITTVFERFYRIYTKENPLSESNSFSEKLVQKFQRLLGKLGFLMQFLLIGLVIYYLIASINMYNSHDFNENFTQIGVFDV